MILMGVDPSFHRTGVSILKGNSIFITCNKTPPDKDKSFNKVFRQADSMSDFIVSIANKYKVDSVISEIPPPQGQFSPGLYCLDSLFLSKLIRIGIKSIYTLYPTYIGHVHGTRNYKKSDSVLLAKEIMEKLPYDIFIDGNLNHDEAESFIFLCRLMVMNGLSLEVLSSYKGLNSSKEIRL